VTYPTLAIVEQHVTNGVITFTIALRNFMDKIVLSAISHQDTFAGMTNRKLLGFKVTCMDTFWMDRKILILMQSFYDPP